MDYFQAHISL